MFLSLDVLECYLTLVNAKLLIPIVFVIILLIEQPEIQAPDFELVGQDSGVKTPRQLRAARIDELFHPISMETEHDQLTEALQPDFFASSPDPTSHMAYFTEDRKASEGSYPHWKSLLISPTMYL